MRKLLIALVLLTGFHVSAFAQGVQTGTIRGTVQDQQGLAMPGVTVTATSTALQGPRTTVTEADGNYTLAALPAGQYTVTFELTGFTTIKQTTSVGVGLQVTQNVTLQTGTLSENIQVVAETPSVIATPAVGMNIRKEEIDSLATARTIQGIATLSPNLTERSPNAGQVVINGAFAWDNVFMVNGVDVNDNLFAHSAEPVHRGRDRRDHRPDLRHLRRIRPLQRRRRQRDHQERRQPLLGQLSRQPAEPGLDGRDAVRIARPPTRRPARPRRSPSISTSCRAFTKPRSVVRSSAIACGSSAPAATRRPIRRSTCQQTGISLISNDLNKRGEVKLTGTVAPNHTLQGGYLNNYRERTNNSGLQSFIIDPASEVDRTNPNMYYFTNYRGVRGNTIWEAQYSQRKFKFADDGGTSTNIVDSPFIALSCACLYNAPYFDATDPENRNNRQISGNVTSFWNGAGRHETKVGYEFFRSQRTGGNSQSSTSYVFNADFELQGGCAGAALRAG